SESVACGAAGTRSSSCHTVIGRLPRRHGQRRLARARRLVGAITGRRPKCPDNEGMKLRIFTEPQQGATYDDLLAVAKTAERLGFDAFFRSDHYLHMGDVDPGPGPTDAWITLAGLARDTSRIRLGTLV